MLGEGWYQFQAQYIPDSSSNFEPALSDVEQVELIEAVGWSENFDSYVVGSDINGQGGWENLQIFRQQTFLQVSNTFSRNGG